jgi:hypothetical protein
VGGILMNKFMKGEVVYLPDPLSPSYYRVARYSADLSLAGERNLIFKTEMTAKIVGQSMANILKCKDDVNEKAYL